jgi:vacuolar-type H+-ATPase subunit E/Vma4
MLTSTRAAKAFEFLIRSDPHDLFEPQIVDKARAALEPIADLRRLVEKIEACARHAAQESIREGMASARPNFA